MCFVLLYGEGDIGFRIIWLNTYGVLAGGCNLREFSILGRLEGCLILIELKIAIGIQKKSGCRGSFLLGCFQSVSVLITPNSAPDLRGCPVGERNGEFARLVDADKKVSHLVRILRRWWGRE